MSRIRVPRLRALAPQRHRSLRLLVGGQAASNVGDACYAVALPWFVLSAHGGVALLGTDLVAYGLPRTALIAAAGYADNDRRCRPGQVAPSLMRSSRT